MATHLLNITPSLSIQNDITFTKLYQKLPTFSHLRVSGYLCYPHLPTPHKLAPQSNSFDSSISPSNHRGYRCFDLSTRKIIISLHVVFKENVFPFYSMTPENPPLYTFLDDPCSISPTSCYYLMSNPPSNEPNPASPPQIEIENTTPTSLNSPKNEISTPSDPLSPLGTKS